MLDLFQLTIPSLRALANIVTKGSKQQIEAVLEAGALQILAKLLKHSR